MEKTSRPPPPDKLNQARSIHKHDTYETDSSPFFTSRLEQPTSESGTASSHNHQYTSRARSSSRSPKPVDTDIYFFDSDRARGSCKRPTSTGNGDGRTPNTEIELERRMRELQHELDEERSCRARTEWECRKLNDRLLSQSQQQNEANERLCSLQNSCARKSGECKALEATASELQKSLDSARAQIFSLQPYMQDLTPDQVAPVCQDFRYSKRTCPNLQEEEEGRKKRRKKTAKLTLSARSLRRSCPMLIDGRRWS
jgi:hypothetical protein